MAGPFIDITKLRKAAPAHPITRFAPSPTGYLHLGHVVSMAYVFGIAELIGAQVLLRVEDHDRQRCRPEYERALYDDMAWLGFIPHNWEALTQHARSDQYRQSDRQERYQQVLTDLAKQHLVYFCGCSRRTVRQSMGDADGHELRYPGSCRKSGLVDSPEHGIRLVVGSENFTNEDLFLGPVTQTPAEQCGDFLVRDLQRNYTYNFAAVVDDMDNAVDVIVRGQDLTHCIGRQLLLAKLLGRAQPLLFGHHPLITDGMGKKLSKRQLSEGIIQRRLSGESGSVVLGEALWLGGWLDAPRPVKAHEVAALLHMRDGI